MSWLSKLLKREEKVVRQEEAVKQRDDVQKRTVQEKQERIYQRLSELEADVIGR